MDPRLVPPAAQRQRGQASVFVVISAAVVVIAALLLYNVGRLNTTRMQLQTAADASAYSGAQLLSRAYNYQAYTNRAVVANQVAVAQMVGLASWNRYFCLTYTDTTCGTFPTTGTAPAIKVGLELFTDGSGLPGVPILLAYQVVTRILFTALENGIPPVIDALEAVITALNAASQAYYVGTVAELGLGATNQGLLAEVVAANDPEAEISSFGMAAVAGTTVLADQFVSLYEPVRTSPNPLAKDDGTRFRDVVLAARDDFSTVRASTETLPFPLFAFGSCGGPLIGAAFYGALYGGTTMLAPDNRSWAAADAAVIAGLGACGGVVYEPEPPPGVLVGVAVLVPLVAPPPFAAATAGESVVPDPIFDLDTTYSGLQPYLDVADTTADNTESPVLTLYVQRGQETIRTTEQLTAMGQGVGTGQLALEDANKGEIMQVGASASARFAPPTEAATLGGQQVLGSLFSPYWEPHLVNTPLLSPFSTVAATAIQ